MKKKLILLFLAGTAALQPAAQDKEETAAPATVVITPESPLRLKDSSLRRAVVRWSVRQLKNEDYQNVKAQPSSAWFPGEVKDGYAFISKTIKIDHRKIKSSLIPIVSRLKYSNPWAATMYSTGLYAVPGQYVEIVIPQSLTGKGLCIQIGCHSDRLDQWVASRQDWCRMPVIVKRKILTKRKTRVASPFGGLVYITASPLSDDWKEHLTISHAVAAPLYRLGSTTPQEWETQLQNNKAPWGELASNDIIITVPDSVLQGVKDPARVMKLWDLIIEGEMDLAQIPRPFYRPQRMVIDEQVSGGFMHSGYPIMVMHSPVKRLYSENIIADPALLMQPSKGGANWGFFHEIGHNMQNLDWVFGGTTEVSCNLFSLYMFDRLMGGRDDAHTGISDEFTQNAMKRYFAAGADYDEWQKDPFLGLILFRQLQEGFGWETFKKVFRAYQTMAAADSKGTYADTDQKKRNLWVSTFSRICGENIAPFIEKWGIPVSPEVKEVLAGLPVWMPYNFPPVN